MRGRLSKSDRKGRGFGEAYWSLANLKTFRFAPDDIKNMNSQLARDSLELSSRVQFHFALGKSAEDEGDHALSFKHYDSGNTLHRSDLNYQSQQNTARAERMKSRFTADFSVTEKAWAAPSLGQSLSLACRVQVRRCWNKFLPVTQWWRAPPSYLTSLRLRRN